jgi:hypothetical protein
MELGPIKEPGKKSGWRSVLMSSFSFVRISSRASPKGKHHEAQGWPRFVRPTLGRDEGVAVNPSMRVEWGFNLFRHAHQAKREH